MLELLFALLMGLAAPVFNNSTDTGSPVTTMNADAEDDPDGDDGSAGGDTGGETGHIPPKPPTP